MPSFPTVVPTAIIKTDEQGQLASYFASQPPLGQDVGRGILQDYFASQPPLEQTVKDIMQPAPAADSTPPPTVTTPNDAISQGIAGADQSIVGMVRDAATKAGIDPGLFLRQIYQESGLNPNAHNASGASGLGQLMPQYYPNVNAYDPAANLQAAASTMANHLQQYGGDWSQALAAYNAGAGNLAKYGLSGLLDDSFAGGQTKRYVANILGTGNALSPVVQSPVPSSSGAPTVGGASPSAPSSGPLAAVGGAAQSLQDYLGGLAANFSQTASSLLRSPVQQNTTTVAPSDNQTTAPSDNITPSQRYNDMVGAQPQPSGGLAGQDLATSPQGPTEGQTIPQVAESIVQGPLGQTFANAQPNTFTPSGFFANRMAAEAQQQQQYPSFSPEELIQYETGRFPQTPENEQRANSTYQAVAASAGPEGITDAVGGEAERAGNILLSKLPEDVQSIVRDTFNAAPATFEAARRGVVSDATVQQLADAAGTTIQKVVDRWQPGNAANAETINALRASLSAKSDQVAALNQQIAGGDSSPAALLQFNLAVKEQQAVQQAVSGVTAEAGRGLRALRANVTSALQSGDPSQMQQLLAKMGGTQWTQELSDRLAKLAPDDTIGRANFIRDAFNPQLKDYLTELWYNAMLSGPHTFAVKSTSEMLSLALSTPEKVMSAAVERPLAALQGRPVERYFGEAPANLVGMVGGVREGVNKFLYTVQHGFTESQALGQDYMRPRAFKGLPGAVINFPSNLLAAGVELTSHIAAAGELNALAYRNAAMEGLGGDALAQRITDLRANPTADMLAAAHKTGLYRAFQQPAAPGSIMQGALQLRNRNWNDAIPVGRIIVPFFQTPVNLAKMGMERSPIAALNLGMWRDFAARNPNASDGIGRWILGSGIGAAIALEVKAGNITGPAPTNPTQADAWRREGKIPWAFHVGDKWISYQHLTPLNQTIGQAATIVNGIERGEDMSQIAGELAMTIGANVIQMPYMQSLSAVLQGINDPSRYGQQFMQGLASSAVPALARVGAQVLDPTVRQVSNPLEAMQADVPGLSQQLPARLDAFGQPRTRLTSDISPIGVSQAIRDPLNDELSRLGVEPGFTGKTMQGINLTRQEQSDYQALSGQLVQQQLNGLIRDPGYAQLNDAGKAYELRRYILDAKKMAGEQYLAQLIAQQGKATIAQRIAAKKAQAFPTPVAP